jgi:alpha 1,6-mannosyltransferase
MIQKYNSIMIHKYNSLASNLSSANLANINLSFFKQFKLITAFTGLMLILLFSSLFSLPDSYDNNLDQTIQFSHKQVVDDLLNILEDDVTHGFNYQPQFTGFNNKKLSKIECQLKNAFPYNSSLPITKAIWQTWKVHLNDSKFPDKNKPHIQSWIDKNPDYTYRLFSDQEMIQFIKQEFSSVPSVLKAFNLMPKPVLKADFFRYLIVFAKGGIYSDIDTVNLKPVESWISSQSTVFNETNDPGLIVGIEADPDMKNWRHYYARRIQFVQWTLQAKVGHPVLRSLITHIIQITLDRARDDLLHQVVGKDAGDDIKNWTGPGIWTDEIFRYLNELIQSRNYFQDQSWDNYHQYLNWKLFTKLTQPIIIHDVAILPITSFCAGMGRMGAGPIDDELAYVQHLFGGNWKNGNIDE